MAGKFSVSTVFKGVDQFSAPLAKMQSKVGAFGASASKSLAAFDQKLGAVHSGIKRVAAAATVIAGVGGAAAFSIGKTGAEFEQAITAVGAVSLQSRDQIAALEAKAKELGATTKFTATQAANAMEVMARAGFSNADILQGVGPVLDAAAASGLEIAEVANHVSNALKGMGLQTSEAGRVADVLAVASSKTNSSIGSLGEALSNVASTARQFKIPLEDTVAGVALLQDVGLDASVAGSALNTMLTQMAKPTDDIAKKMKRFGVRFKDAKGNMLPFPEVLANISKAAKKSGGNMDQVAFFADLVGLRGQKAAANLKDLFESGRVGDLTKQLQNAEGAAKKMAAIRMNNTIGDLTLLDSAIDGVKVSLFETQSGPLRGIIQGMTKWVETNKELIVSEFQTWVQRVRDHFSEIVTWLERIGVAVGVFYALAAAVKIARLAVAAYELATKLAAGATWLWNAAVDAAFFSNLGLVGEIIAYKVAQWASWVATGAVTAATWLYEAAIWAGQIGTAEFTVAQVASKVAQWASWVATGAVTAATWLYEAAVWAVQLATKEFTAAEVLSKLAQWASTAATWLANAAQTAYALVVGGTTGALGLFTGAAWSSVTAIGAQAAALAPFLLTLGAVTAAVLALYAAWNQLSKLSNELSGSGGILGTVSKMVEMGTWDPFKAHDAAMNEKARKERDQPKPKAQVATDQPQIISPEQRAAIESAQAYANAMVNGEITVAPAPGTKATVKAKPNTVPLRLQPSGAF